MSRDTQYLNSNYCRRSELKSYRVVSPEMIGLLRVVDIWPFKILQMRGRLPVGR